MYIYLILLCFNNSLGIKLADASKLFAKKFSCGSSVVKNPSLVDEIDIQGDVKEDIVDFILEKWPQVPPPTFTL